ncbi:MAG: DUF11 domain-containing protein [Anaerolineae bacterium]|nr:DUF11 domain-containing protein [Anaerolineae bacterium]
MFKQIVIDLVKSRTHCLRRPKRSPGFNLRHIFSWLWLGMFISFLFWPATPARALPAGFQEYYVLGNEEQIYDMFDYIDTGSNITSNQMRSVVTVVATTDNQVFYYDHWEDGFEADIFSPIQSSTEIYGDGDPDNGGSGADILGVGDIVLLKSDGSGSGINALIPVNPRDTADIRYDGGDYLVSTGGPIDLAHAMWPQDGTWIGGAWEVYSLQAWENSFSFHIPVGQDMGGDFTYAWLQIGALHHNTTVTIDNGSQTLTVNLDQGQTYSSLGAIDSQSSTPITINKGTTISSDKQIQVGLVSGSTGTFQTRFFVMLPDMLWGTEYIAAVPRTTASNEAQIYLFNPNNHSITVEAHDTDGNNLIIIPANDVAVYSQQAGYVPIGSGVRLNSDDIFWGVVTADTLSTSYDWGFSLIPTVFLMDDYYVCWAPGNVLADITDGTNASPVWVAPVADNTTFYVDYGPIDGVVDETFTLDALVTRRIFDPDYDNTGMRIWATNKFVPIWGVDPASLEAGDGYLDLGYTVLPLNQGWLDPVLTLEKTASPEILPVDGGTTTFNLQAHTHGPSPVTNVNITDTLPISWTYLPGTSLVTYPDGSTAAPEPSVNGQTLFWNLSHTMDSNQTLAVQFQAQIQTGGQVGAAIADDFETGTVYDGGSGSWTGNWQETGETTSQTGGNIRIVDQDDDVNVTPYGGSKQLRLQNDNRTIHRGLDLSDFARPVLRFKRYFRSFEGSETFGVDISVNNGDSYASLLSWTNPVTQNVWVQETVDLSAYITSTARIRIRGISGAGDDDYAYFDEVEIYDAAVVSENQGLAVGNYNNHTFNATDNAVVAISALDLEKTVDRSIAEIGDSLVYTLTYENSGAITTTGAYIDDLVPVGTTFAAASGGGAYISATNTVRWSLDEVAPAATDSVTFTVTVNNETLNGAEIENFGRIDSDQTALVNSNRVRTTVQAPDLNLTLAGPTIAAPGQVVTYTLTYANNGDAAATGVIISNTIPVSMTYLAGSLAINTGSGWVSLSDAVDTDAGQYVGTTVGVLPGVVSGALAAGETGQIRFAVTIAPTMPQGSTLGNIAQIDSEQLPPQNSNLFSIDISPLSLSKVGDRSIATAGQTIVFTGTYANNGSAVLNNILLIDSIPANTQLISGTVAAGGMDAVAYSTDHGVTWNSGFTNPVSVTHIRWSRATLPISQSDTVSFQVKVADPLPGNTTIQNEARITSTQTAASGWLYSNLVSIGTVDLTLSKIASGAFVRAGDPITYTLTYGNRGSVAATGVVITDLVPAQTAYVPGSIFGAGADDSDPAEVAWNLTVPANSGGHKIGFVVAVTDTAAPGTSIYNTASMASASDNATSNQVQVTVAQDGVTISPNRSNNTHDQGQQVCYGHTVGNTGNLTNTMELTTAHNAWTSATVTFYRDYDADGNYDAGLDTTLTDTNSNTTVDTGELLPAGQINILACFTIPAAGVNDGDVDTLTVQAATAAGDAYTSQVMDVTTVRIENFLTITSPAVDLVTNTTTINYSGVTNPNATVIITNTATGVVYNVTADGFGNFATTITTTLGANTITAQSTDLDSDVAADTRTVTLVSDPTDSSNSVTIIQPTAGTITSTAALSVTGATDPNSVITVTIGSAGPYTTTADNGGNFSLTVTLPEIGANTIEVTSTDPFGNVDTDTCVVQLTNDGTDLTNTLVITTPTAGQVFTTSVVSVVGQTDPGSAITITVSTGDVVTGTANLTDGTFDLGGVDLVTGTNVITVVSADPYGNLVTETLTVILTNDDSPGANTITITAPASGHITTTTSIEVAGATDPDSVITVTTPASAFNMTANDSGAFSGAVTLHYGLNTIVAVSTDVYGQVATDTIQVRLTNDTTPGGNDVAIIFPPVGYVTTTATLPVTGTANADSVITVTVGVNGPYTTTADSSGLYTVTVTLPVTGMNTIAVTATDLYGNQATATRQVQLTNDSTPTGADVAITFPPVGYTTTDPSLIVTGTGDPGAAITVTVAGDGPFTTIVDNSGLFTVSVTLPTAGINTIVVTATDVYGNVDTASRDVERQPFINFNAGAYSVDEGDTATITVTLSAASNVTTTVTYATGDGTATAGSDYTGASSVLTFAPGVTLQTIAIPVAADGLDENNETFTLTLSAPVSGTLGATASATVTINDGDDLPTVNFSSGSQSLGEGAGVYTVTIELAAPSGLDVTIPFTVSGTATEGSGDDFTISSSPVTIPAGQTGVVITITLNEDTQAEDDETVILTLGSPTNATVGSTGSHTLTINDNDFTLTPHVAGSGSIGVDPDQTTFTSGSVVTLTASAEPGWTFTTWSGDLSGSANPINTTMTANKEVTATFTQAEYTLQTVVVGRGWILTSPAKSTYSYGEVVTLTAFADFGWTFNGWDGDLSGSAISDTLTMTGNKVVTATFSQDEYTLTVSTVGNGSVVSNPVQSTYTYGEVVTLTATADPGWTFSGWSGDVVSSDNPDTVTMTGDKVVTATFTPNGYILTVTATGNGSVVSNPVKSTYAYGEVVTLTATADPSWTFSGWSGDVSGSANPATITMTHDSAVTATFAAADTSTTLDFSKSAVDVDGAPLFVADTVRYTLQVKNTGTTYTAFNVIVTDTLPAGDVTVVGTSSSKGSLSGSNQLIWNVGQVLPGETATLEITVTLNSGTVGKSVINTAALFSDNAPAHLVAVCADGSAPNGAVCATTPQESPLEAGGVFLPIVIKGR